MQKVLGKDGWTEWSEKLWDEDEKIQCYAKQGNVIYSEKVTIYKIPEWCEYKLEQIVMGKENEKKLSDMQTM